jgi:periplasmic protein TonB
MSGKNRSPLILFVLVGTLLPALAPSAQTPSEPTFHAGVGGVGIPICVYCPPPEYTKKARKDKVQGTVVVKVTITPDGRATNISIVKSLREDLDTQAINAVAKWKFKPATGPNGKLVPVICPIEVTFRPY